MPVARSLASRCLRVGLLGLALFAATSAQVILNAYGGAPSEANPHFRTASAGAQLGIALPTVPHLQWTWNFAGLNWDRLAGHNGGSLTTGLEAWVSPHARPAQSFGPLLIGEAGLGRRWGWGLHGFTSLGVGAGWSWGDWVPYIEFRRRASFHSGRPVDHQVLIGLHFILFG